jgi:hypothetical protein
VDAVAAAELDDARRERRDARAELVEPRRS